MAGPRIEQQNLIGAQQALVRNKTADQMAGMPSFLWGNTYYVDSGATNALDISGGGTFSRPFATIDYAIGQCTADQNDTILVAPGHAEAIASAGGITCDVAGIRIIGCGWGSLRPAITFATLTTATMTVTAANVWIENLWFECNKTGADHAVMIPITGAHCTLKNCIFTEGTTNEQSLDYVSLDGTGADFCTIENCRFISETAGSSAAIAIDAAVNEFKLINSDIQGDFSEACVHSASAHLNCRVLNNVFRNDGAADHAIEFSAAATGIIAYNMVQTAVTAGGAADAIDCGSCGCVQNFAADADADTSGVLTPPAT